MGNKKLFSILSILVIIIVSFIIGFFIGTSNAPVPNIAIVNNNSQTFYATITNIKDNKISVKGLNVNDINYRGEFNFSIKDNTTITWRGENIDIADLKIGDKISITFTDETIIDIYPTPLNEVIKVQLLEDKNSIQNKINEFEHSRKFSITFNQRKDLIEIKELYNTGEYKVKTIGGDATISIDDTTYSLEDALEQKIIIADDILNQAIMDEQYGVCTTSSYDDGGSKEYYYDDYTILKLNNLSRDKDLIIGPKGGAIINIYNMLTQNVDFKMNKNTK